uniref:Uncharacterized protein n=1 Tax=viral metagenome TaxID=1070528 RepID=A0A6C0D886_9ZZZZ
MDYSDCSDEEIDREYHDERVTLNNYYESIYNNDSQNEVVKNDKERKINYPGLEGLNKELIEVFLLQNYDKCKNGKINICSYQINKSGKMPFLQFFLRKFDKNDETKPDMLTFPSFTYNNLIEVMGICETIQKIICMSNHLKPSNYEYKGFLNNKNEFYVFYEMKNDIVNIHNLYRTNDLWLVLMDEILNHNKVGNFKIEQSVINFFSRNFTLCYLKDENDEYYDTPVVAYIGCKNKEADFISTFGVSKTQKEYLKESLFYFTDYNNAFKMCDNNNKEKLCIVRFALFTGHMNIMMNAKFNDEVLLDNNYDSVYIGNEEESPLWGLKFYEQQVPLTCHYIDNKSLKMEYDDDKKILYYIL